MSRRPTRLEQIFNIEVPPASLMTINDGDPPSVLNDSRSSTPLPQIGSDDLDLSGSRNPLTPISRGGGTDNGILDGGGGDGDIISAADNFNAHFIRSYSVDGGGIEMSSTAGPSRSRGVSYHRVISKHIFLQFYFGIFF